ncbi:DNA-directed RNA polymerase subunit epsilon [Weissella viridescens]|jgi:DNA-dependent RNA polymerase auxiliary subunit epsilon|uniref:DNA-directed RNA polymerase subunit epsilon n=1 Tax=Weissella viridescens TaxID=1629 RepID=A0A0R2H1I2_WEIVI|nr:DNA-directed RNA polymerase subunit epsilon [Weissella viridescens]KRN46785.1 hypothetical protein IV50_GL000047 [Weissella viridescens]MBX4172488.1 DNA-dependent RNA polymerase auxiliary subunit epsilon family protein [Weissella viridescens]MCB6839625.1 DNA-dependent RNA polymerase auxiliary subunit epsilon family protein [Weissella viridescens]MCB6846356.1 DNA-dependent RNA polymerase auxiliary subunit epsilon family protein [Weissella viridescens]QOD86713.1 DNA-dependent RNA polymerase a
MIFKVYYQESKQRNPKREDTHSLYLDVPDQPTARREVEKNTDYNVEQIEQLSEKALAYEQQSPDFKLTEF